MKAKDLGRMRFVVAADRDLLMSPVKTQNSGPMQPRGRVRTARRRLKIVEVHTSIVLYNTKATKLTEMQAHIQTETPHRNC